MQNCKANLLRFSEIATKSELSAKDRGPLGQGKHSADYAETQASYLNIKETEAQENLNASSGTVIYVKASALIEKGMGL